MKKIFLFIRELLPHFVIILSAMMLTFFVVDRFNRAMGFINNNITKWMLAVFCVLTIALAVVYIIERRKSGQKKEEDREQ